MIDVKAIILRERKENHEEFIEVCKRYFPSITLINNMVDFLKEIMMARDHISVIFIEKALEKKLNENLIRLLQNDNFTCIIFGDFNAPEDNYISFFEYLACKDKIKVTHFMENLSRNIDLKEKLINNYQMLNKFYDLGKQLFAEKDMEKQIAIIVANSMELTFADAASLYIIAEKDTCNYTFYEKEADNKLLKFIIAKNNSIDVKLQSTTVEISDSSLIGASVIGGKPIRIEDAYNIPSDESYEFNRSFDEITGYRTKSVLTIPMKDHEERVIGVIQLINKKINDHIMPFNSLDESLMFSLAGLAAVVMENNLLNNNLKAMLEKERKLVKEEISKRTRADEEINRLLSAVEHSPVSVVITDSKGRIEYVNSRFEEFTGYTYAEVARKNHWILKSSKEEADFYVNLWRTIEQGNTWKGEIYNQKKNGEFYWVNSSIAPVFDGEGNIKYFINVQEDITERKRLIAELDEKNANLEKALKQLQLSQARLVHNEKLAGIGQLAAGVAHEMNSPLGYVISNLSTLKEYYRKLKDLILQYQDVIYILGDSDNRELTRELLQKLRTYERDNRIDYILSDIGSLMEESNDGLARVSEIINVLRTFSSIDHFEGKQIFNLNVNINNCLFILKQELGEMITLHKEFGDIPPICADGKEINQVVLQLVKNSIYAIKCKFKSENQGKIIVRTYYKDSNVWIEVEDNGIGIEEKNMTKIFDPFFTTKPIGEGMGLGLSIAYDIITTKHKGDIRFLSEYGCGTKCIIRLPV